jgi:hypothetical protein
MKYGKDPHIHCKGLFKRMQHCPTLLDQQCWTIVGQRVQTDATIQQLLAQISSSISTKFCLKIRTV